jgi:hypothetical protein
MNVVIPKNLERQVKLRAQKRGLTQSEYVRAALVQIIAAESDTDSEMQLWEAASLADFKIFSRTHKA